LYEYTHTHTHTQRTLDNAHDNTQDNTHKLSLSLSLSISLSLPHTHTHTHTQAQTGGSKAETQQSLSATHSATRGQAAATPAAHARDTPSLPPRPRRDPALQVSCCVGWALGGEVRARRRERHTHVPLGVASALASSLPSSLLQAPTPLSACTDPPPARPQLGDMRATWVNP